MANTLTPFIPDLYEALDVISRELTGLIPAVNRDSDIARAALNESVLVPVTREETAADNTPGTNAPDTGDATLDNVEVTISKSKHIPVRFNGEETKGLRNAGLFSSIRAERLYQGMRTLVNMIEADLWSTAYKAASRAYGEPGTTPFGTANDMTDFSGVLGELEKNGTPTNDLQLALGHAAIGNLRGKQSGLFKVNEAGTADMLRNGITDRVMKMALRHSDAIGLHSAGSITDNVTVTGANAVGTTEIGVTTDGTGEVDLSAGDIITVNGDANQYVVASDVTVGNSDTGTITIAKPGLRVATSGSEAVEALGSYTGNLAFARSAIVLATRSPAMPDGGDMAQDVQTVVDELTGLSFEVALYKQFLQNTIHVRIAWGQAAVKGEHIAALLG